MSSARRANPSAKSHLLRIVGIGGGGTRPATGEEVADYMSRSPHWAVLMRLTKELGWEDVHRYLGMTKYGFVSMRLPMPPS